MSRLPTQFLTIHGNLLRWQQCGILLLGKPNSGKSFLSWVLLQRGAKLISDDLVGIFLRKDHYYGFDPSLAYQQTLCLNDQFQRIPKAYCSAFTRIHHVYYLEKNLVTSGDFL